MASEQHNQTEPSVRSTLRSAIQAAKSGRRRAAYQLLRQVVAADPSNEVAWLWLAGVAEQPSEALASLGRVEQLNPENPRLKAARSWAQTRATSAPEHPQGVSPRSDPASLDTRPRARWSRRLWAAAGSLATVLLMGGLVLMMWVQVRAAQARLPGVPTPENPERVSALQPELNAAVTESRWEDAVAVLQVMHALDPANQAVKNQLAQVYYQLALHRRDQGDLDDAIDALDESLALAPDDPSAKQQRRLMGAYQEGVSYHQTGDWLGTIRTLALVRLEEPAYLDVSEVLYSAYYNLGLSQQAAGDLVGALASYQAALELLPEEELARDKADEVDLLLRPPTPAPTPTPGPTPEPGPQNIVVDISEQRMYVYEGEELRWKWVISTGEPGRDTATGQFAIQSKIPMAYASTWNLDMPHWLGIYWSGPLENGIHALPIKRDTGYKLWDGFLGQRVSYGCVILDDENAETLYEWVEMGTPVTIQL